MPNAFRPFLAIVGGILAVASAPAQNIASPAIATQLEGLSAADADRLIVTIKDVQAKLKSGEKLYFMLLSGAPASYDMAGISPRDAFLGLSFDRPFRITRTPTDNRLWQPHRITVLPNGPGQLGWDIDVVLGMSGNIERVEMTYRPPAPF